MKSLIIIASLLLAGCADIGADAPTTDGVLVGDYIVTNSQDVAELDGYVEVTGNLGFDAPGLRDATLRTLRRVGGDLQLNYVLPRELRDLRSVSFPALEHVGGGVAVAAQDALEALSLPSLRSTRNIGIGSNYSLSVVDLRSLSASPGGIAVLDNPELPQCLVDEVLQQAPGGTTKTGGNRDGCVCSGGMGEIVCP